MQSYKVKGKVVALGEVKTFGSFSKRDVVLDVTAPGSKYVDNALVEFSGKSLGKTVEMRLGDEVEVTFVLSARQSKDGRWFGGVRGIDATVISASSRPVPPPAEPADSGDGDMPF